MTGEGGAPLHIAVVNTARNFGGQEAMAALLSNELLARGNDVLFLCRKVFPAFGRLSPGLHVRSVLGGVDWSPPGIARARRVLRLHRSQVMLVTTNKDMRSAALAAWSLAVPVVVRRAMARRLRGSLHYRILYGGIPAHIVTNSQATRRIMLDSAPWMEGGKVSVILNGVDPAPFQTGAALPLDIPPGAIVVGFVGRFVEWKGVLTLADAWRALSPELPELHLVLAGAGEMEEAMRERLAGAGRVHWLGFRSDIPAVMQALDILAFPSRMEGFGLSAVEAMASGVPVIAADAGALPEVVGHEKEGLLIPPDDAGALAAAIRRLARDAGLRARMGATGRARVLRDFSVARMVDGYEAILRRAVHPLQAGG